MIRKISVLALAPAILAALAAFPAVARANADAVQFGEKIHATAANPVHDAVCFFCSVQIGLDAERAGRTVQHEDQRKRPATVGPVVLDQDVMPADRDRLLQIAIGAGCRNPDRRSLPGHANEARQPRKDNAE